MGMELLLAMGLSSNTNMAFLCEGSTSNKKYDFDYEKTWCYYMREYVYYGYRMWK